MRYSLTCGLLALSLLAGCQAESVEPTKVSSVAVDPANLEVVNFSVPDMHCEFACAPKVREVLEAQPGVAEVEVDLPSKTARVKADRDQFDAEAAVAALVDVQFDASRLITSQEADEAKAAAKAEASDPATEEESTPAEGATTET